MISGSGLSIAKGRSYRRIGSDWRSRSRDLDSAPQVYLSNPNIISLTNSNYINHSSSTIIETLQTASADLLWMSESEYPFEVFFWQLPPGTEITPETILDRLKVSADTPIYFTDLETFFAVATTPQDWHGAVETETVNRYKNLIKIIEKNLTDIQVIRAGKINIDVYIVGKTTDGNLAGLKTQLVET